MNEPANFLALALICLWLGFALGCLCTSKSLEKRVEYQERMAGEWFLRWREQCLLTESMQRERDEDADWWKRSTGDGHDRG